jgi:hypothetical protein
MKKTAFTLALALLGLALPATAQSIITREKMTRAVMNKKGEIEVTASANSSANDFDFLTGKWTMDNRKLKSRLTKCTEWDTFVSTSENLGRILEGVGNLDFYRATFDGKPYEGLTVRVFNPNTRLWSLFWVASDVGIMDPPVVGSFDGPIGLFYCKDIYRGTPVIVVFKWDKTDPENPVWSQAFSTDNGVTWEWNATNTSHRIK